MSKIEIGFLNDNTVSVDKIEANAVTTAKILNLNVTTAKIDALAVTTAKIDALAVTTAKIDALAVTTAKINALAVTDAKIATDAVTKVKVANNAIGAPEIDISLIQGDLIFGTGADTWNRLPKGTVDQLLTMNNSNAPIWADPPATVETFISSTQTIVAAGAFTIAHGLSGAPQIVQCYLRCQLTSSGWSVGDEVLVGSYSSSNVSRFIAYGANATNIVAKQGSSGDLNIISKSSGTNEGLNFSSWRWLFKAVYFA